MILQQTAIEFLNYFCEGNIDSLSAMLDENFTFKGPFIEYATKESYIASLLENPPIDCGIEIVKAFEEGVEAGLFYIFSKPGVSTPMAQYFKFDNGKITESLLVFDSGAF